MLKLVGRPDFCNDILCICSESFLSNTLGTYFCSWEQKLWHNSLWSFSSYRTCTAYGRNILDDRWYVRFATVFRLKIPPFDYFQGKSHRILLTHLHCWSAHSHTPTTGACFSRKMRCYLLLEGLFFFFSFSHKSGPLNWVKVNVPWGRRSVDNITTAAASTVGTHFAHFILHQITHGHWSQNCLPHY